MENDNPLLLSPELALVDPELAQLARSRLPQPLEWSPRPRPAVPEGAPADPPEPYWSQPSRRRSPRSRRPLRAALRAAGAFATAVPALLLGAVVVGMVASEVRAQLVDESALLSAPAAKRPPATTAAPQASATPSPRTRSSTRAPLPKPPKPTARPPVATTPAPRAKPQTRAVTPAKPPTKTNAAPKPPPRAAPKAAPIAPARATGSWIPTKAEIEARTLGLLQERVALWVPPELLDKKTNLLVNNVQVACRQVGRTPRFDCRLEAGHSRGSWLLTALAARDGSVELRWRGHAPAR